MFGSDTWLNTGISTATTNPSLSDTGTETDASPSVMRAQVEKTIEVIRPALKADGGDIILHDVDDSTGVITVELIGACVGCPASTQTLKAGIERIMRDRIDGVTEVINVA
jgi:Fe-S cluster biogenesis protein NfuA